MANLSERGAAGELLGYTVAEVCGRPITPLLEPVGHLTRHRLLHQLRILSRYLLVREFAPPTPH
ncbi:hypothetical protein ACWD5F_40845 [Streptomyces sp. NPDC002499]